MKNLEIHTNPEVTSLIETYPACVRKRLLYLRQLIIETASEQEEITVLDETLKWGEPSYLTKHGSTIRMDWKQETPEQYALYFKCTSKLVPTFRRLFKDVFSFERQRAILFRINEEIPENELKCCVRAALRYHKVKNMPDLGIELKSRTNQIHKI